MHKICSILTPSSLLFLCIKGLLSGLIHDARAGVVINPGKLRSSSDSEEYFGITYHGQATDNSISRIYNNVVLNVNNAFMFLNREDAVGQKYEFAYNTVHNFTHRGPIKLYCSGVSLCFVS